MSEDNKGCAVLVFVVLGIVFVLGTLNRIDKIEKQLRNVEYECRVLKNELDKIKQDK